jgi:hypothetical protein
MTDEWERIWKEVTVTESMYCSGICVDGRGNNSKKNLRQDSDRLRAGR